MKMMYNEYLSPAQRKMYTQRLLTLHQVLGESEDENYYHPAVIRHGFSNSCGTAACAIGHAVWHAERFPGFEVEYDSFGRPVGTANGSNQYFGPNTWRYIFDGDAYKGEYPSITSLCGDGVTRAMAMKRIEEYVEQVLGCKLIE